MQILFEDGHSIAGHELLSTRLRTDLVPVPVSLELVVKRTADLSKRLVDHAKIWMNDWPLTIVKTEDYRSQLLQEGKALGAIKVIAVLQGCERLLYPAANAVILQGTSFAEAYRACGASVVFPEDIPLPDFVCLKGQIPTYEIAKALQLESACVRYTPTGLSVLRLDQLFKPDPVAAFDPSDVVWVSNQAVVTATIPDVVSTASDNSPVRSDDGINARPVIYHARLDHRQIQNLKTVLVTKATLQRPLNYEWQAGRSVLIGERRFAILTALHRTDTAPMGGNPVFASKLWLSEIGA